MALGRVLVAVALGAHQHVVLGGERPIHQRSFARTAEEALAVPVAVLVRQILQSQRKKSLFGFVTGKFQQKNRNMSKHF